MNNNTDHIISNENDAPPVTFIKWPLDMDDDEFRAGYPFSPVPLEELNEQKKWCVSSPTSNDDDFQLDNSSNNDSNKTIKADNQSNGFVYDGQKKHMKFDVKFSTIRDDSNDYNINENQKQDHEKDVRDQYDHCSIVQTDNVNNKQTDEAHSTKSKR